MRFHLVCVGRLKAGPERDLAYHYLTRASGLGRSLGVSAVDMREIEESKARRPQDRKKDEAKALRALLIDLGAAPGGFIACDETGENLTSPGFAERLRRLRDQGVNDLAFLLGGPDGLDPDFRAEAAFSVAFGALTWPHQLARIMAAEQIYRALTVLAGHPYHRA
jgi:23S rRNA (pseudouridine1915-N3)-methyltransferase